MRKTILLTVVFILFLSFSVTLAQEDSSPSSEIRERVQQKVEEALNKPKAYLGTVTDISDTTIQIKALTGEIRQVTPSKETVDVVSVGATSKVATVDDIAIGDFTVSMGYKNGNGVLEAERILIMTAPLPETKRKSYKATVTEFSGGEGVIKTTKGEEINLETSSSTRYQLVEEGEIIAARVADLKEGSEVIISGVQEEKILEVRRILITAQAQISE